MLHPTYSPPLTVSLDKKTGLIKKPAAVANGSNRFGVRMTPSGQTMEIRAEADINAWETLTCRYTKGNRLFLIQNYSLTQPPRTAVKNLNTVMFIVYNVHEDIRNLSLFLTKHCYIYGLKNTIWSIKQWVAEKSYKKCFYFKGKN